MGLQRLVERADRRHIHGHQAGVCADEVMGEGHIEHGLPRRSCIPPVALLSHQGSDQQYELALGWDAQGIAESIWTIPNDARQGTYELTINGKTTSGDDFVSNETFAFDKGVEPKLLGIALNGPASIDLGEW